MTVLHVLAPARYGGLERVVAALAAGQAAAGHRVHVAAVVSPADREQPLFDSLRRARVLVHRFVLRPRAYLAERRLIRGLCREIGPSVVHTHGYRSDVLVGGVTRSLGVPQVTTVHGFTAGGMKNRVYERLQLRAFRRLAAVVAVSRAQVSELEAAGVARQRIHLIPNAWSGEVSGLSRAEARLRLRVDLEAPLVGWVGRLSPEKGADVLVAAATYLRDVPVTFAVIGDGRERQQLELLAAGSAVSDRFHWHGAVPLASELFPAFDVFVLSSRTEGTPIALFEAMAMGIPIVATSVGGVPDVISDAEALLVPPDAPAALAEAVRRTLADRAAALERATRARERLNRKYAPGPWLGRYEALYEEVARRGDPGGSVATGSD